MKIDRRCKYMLVLDTETATRDTTKGIYGTNMLVYDIGGVVVNRKGEIFEQFSFIVKEVFFNHKMMENAYYYNKTPQYIIEASEGKRIIASWFEIKEYIYNLMEEYGITEVWAYNAIFDDGTLKRTNKDLGGDWGYFPKGTTVKCIMRLAECSICQQKMYNHFCMNHGYMTNHSNPRCRRTAEIVYRYINGTNEFIEDHTALEDSYIEAKILAKCFRQHKKMKPSIIVVEY